MQLHTALIGSDTELLLEMSLRAIAVFGIALALIRISGRRSFGQKTPFERFGLFIDDAERPLVVNGEIIEANMRKDLITKRDLYEVQY